MHDVSNAINILDPNKGGSGAIDKKICNKGSNSTSSWTNLSVASHGDKEAGVVGGTKCATHTGSTDVGLLAVVSDTNGPTDSSFTQTTKMEVLPNTSANISKDIIALNKEQKRVVSSAFAKAHEEVH